MDHLRADLVLEIAALAKQELARQQQRAVTPCLRLQQIKMLEGRIAAVAAQRPCTRLMTVSGVGPMTALAFTTAIDDPGRFRRSSSVGLISADAATPPVGRGGLGGPHLQAWRRAGPAHAPSSRPAACWRGVLKWPPPKAWAARLVRMPSSPRLRRGRYAAPVEKPGMRP